VAGVVETFPVSEAQRLDEPAHGPHSLERDFPEIYQGVLEVAEVLVTEQGLNHQEIEFTFESDRGEDLYVLQTRDAVTTAGECCRRLSRRRSWKPRGLRPASAWAGAHCVAASPIAKRSSMRWPATTR